MSRTGPGSQIAAAVLTAALTAAPAAAVAFGPISVDGHRSMSTRDVEAVVYAAADSLNEASLSAAADSLLAELARLGRPFARVQMIWGEDVSGGDLRIRIDEGPDVRLASVELTGGGPEPPGGTELLAARPGSRATRGIVVSDAEALLSAFEDDGRPFATVVPHVVAFDASGGLSLAYDVRPGPEVFFGPLLVEGNSLTKRRVVARESGVLEGERYSASRVARIRPRLERTGLFAEVEEPLVGVDPSTGLATVGVRVREARSSRISGVLGYAPPAFGEESGELTGTVEVALGNISGTGRRARVEWRRVSRDESRIAFEYTEPWVLGAPIDVGVSGGQAVSDTVYTTTEADLLVSARAGDRARFTWSLGALRYVPVAPGAATTTSYRTGLEAEYDGTDAPFNPTRGYSADTKLEYAAKEERGSGDDEQSVVLTVAGRAYLRARPRQVVALGARLVGLYSTEDDVPVHELPAIGGASSLRGYREDQFRGTRTALATLEYRFILGRRARAVAFVDAGYRYRPAPNFAKDTKLGYGIGLRGETRLGIISVDYGLGEGDALLDGKLHVGLIRDF